MTNAVNDQKTFLVKDLVNDSIVALTKFEKPRKVAFQRLRFDVLNVLSQPSNAVYKAAGDGGIESLQLSAGALEDSRSEHGLGQLQTAYHVFQEFSALTLGHGSLLLQEPFAQTLPKHQSFVRVTQEFDEFFFDCQTDELFKFVGSHFSKDLRHNLSFRLSTPNNSNDSRRSARLNSVYVSRHIPVLRRLTTAAILLDLQGLIKVRGNPPVPTNIDQHKPIMVAAN